jgi:hypothetical protein
MRNFDVGIGKLFLVVSFLTHYTVVSVKVTKLLSYGTSHTSYQCTYLSTGSDENICCVLLLAGRILYKRSKSSRTKCIPAAFDHIKSILTYSHHLQNC